MERLSNVRLPGRGPGEDAVSEPENEIDPAGIPTALASGSGAASTSASVDTVNLGESISRAGGPPRLDFLSPCEKSWLLGRFGTYEVIEIAGRGGMGMVLKAFDPALHRFVAIKVLPPTLAGSEAAC